MRPANRTSSRVGPVPQRGRQLASSAMAAVALVVVGLSGNAAAVGLSGQQVGPAHESPAGDECTDRKSDTELSGSRVLMDDKDKDRCKGNAIEVTEVEGNTVDVAPGGSETSIAVCPEGQVAISGGHNFTVGGVPGFSRQVTTTNPGDSWRVDLDNPPTNTENEDGQAYAYCVPGSATPVQNAAATETPVGGRATS
ncbi:hypothetical protein GLX30_13820 [Streptomyces sp. Tu 2975]|uniref:hypothetical protein n=1 Tax=Streptomyces sp. Tu 2975 TaxID=2676871 RepID=UPI00135C4FD5|nr:hypothetical protein [Streptomyces sp. Tu 2975]QIP84927.1 hypothetical protein GLX30_13820 [Streptomyces sp. Tu 2975]